MLYGLHINVSLILCLMVLLGCSSARLPGEQGDTFIQLYKGGCDGQCESYKLSIRPNRRARYDGLAFVKMKGQQKCKLSKNLNTEIWEEVEKIDWATQSRKVAPRQPGGQLVTVVYVKGGIRKEVSFKGKIPLEMGALVKYFENAKANGKWKVVKQKT